MGIEAKVQVQGKKLDEEKTSDIKVDTYLKKTDPYTPQEIQNSLESKTNNSSNLNPFAYVVGGTAVSILAGTVIAHALNLDGAVVAQLYAGSTLFGVSVGTIAYSIFGKKSETIKRETYEQEDIGLDSLLSDGFDRGRLEEYFDINLIIPAAKKSRAKYSLLNKGEDDKDLTLRCHFPKLIEDDYYLDVGITETGLELNFYNKLKSGKIINNLELTIRTKKELLSFKDSFASEFTTDNYKITQVNTCLNRLKKERPSVYFALESLLSR